MITFFQNIWAWISAHAAQIAAIIALACLAVLVILAVYTVRQRKTVQGNTDAAKQLKDSLAANDRLQDTAKELSTRVAALDERVSDLQDATAQCLTKLNCVLDVQQEAYSVSLAKTKTLDAINGIIANGKFAETHVRKAITDEVAELRAQIEGIMEKTTESEKKVKRMAGIENTTAAQEKSGVQYD